jgi:hypothetical protein
MTICLIVALVALAVLALIEVTPAERPRPPTPGSW